MQIENKPIKMGNEIFIPQTYNEREFIMKWSMQGGGMVPPHLHQYMDEHFKVLSGEAVFTVAGKKVLKKQGEEISVPKGTPHSLKNNQKENVEMMVTYSPCADTHIHMKILAGFEDANPGAKTNLLKYLYVSRRLNIREFSQPHPKWAGAIIFSIVDLIGNMAGWGKLSKKYGA